jgi:hypothetical protein
LGNTKITTAISAMNVDDWYHSGLEIARAVGDCVLVLGVFGWKIRRVCGWKAMCLTRSKAEVVVKKIPR